MRVAAVALVLIVGAAVVLAFANTLNSWVLGGLIGGLAALLLSIPISLVLFTLLARRQDERLRLDEDAYTYVEEPVFDDQYDGDDYEVEAEAYILPEDEDDYYDPHQRRRLPPERDWDYNEQQRLREPRNYGRAADSPRLPAAGESLASRRPPSDPRNASRRARPTAHLPEYEKRAPGGRAAPDRRPTRTTRSLAEHQAAARRAARREAERQYEDDIDVIPTSAALSRRPLAERHPRPTRQLYQQRPLRRNAGQAQPSRERQPEEDYGYDSYDEFDEYAAREAQTEELRKRQAAQTGQVGGYPETGPVRPQPRTGQIARNPQLGDQQRNPDRISGSLKNPLVRRAPYLYEDDPLREKLAQQIEGPITRRSSLYDPPPDQEEE